MDNEAPNSLGEALREASLFLQANGHDHGTAQQYWQLLFNVTLTELVDQLRKPINIVDYQKFVEALERLIDDEPIQYISGTANFMGEDFIVNRHTLIPREETAGLVNIALNAMDSNRHYRVLDLGTGSGIIGIMIKKLRPNSHVVASDISQDSLLVAKKNAKMHQVVLEFIQSDLFASIYQRDFDIIISNPPYISQNEESLMDNSVLKYEPAQALFARNNGLEFYYKIASSLKDYMTPNGLVLLEIGFSQGKFVENIFRNVTPGAKIEIVNDFNQKNRYVTIQLEG